MNVGLRALAVRDDAQGQDPPGFDRTAYQAQLRDDILTFLRAHLA